jgi:hypothetical protein
MYQKWKAKFDPDTIATRFEQVKDIAQERYEAAQSVIATVVDEARNTLTDLGVPPAQWGMYLAFVEQLAKASFSHRGAVLEKIAAGLKARYVTALGADPTVLDQLAQIVIGTVPPY